MRFFTRTVTDNLDKTEFNLDDVLSDLIDENNRVLLALEAF